MQKKIISIDLNTIKTTILDREQEIKKQLTEQNIIPRTIELEKIKNLVSSDLVTIITGVRRCGKSTLAIALCMPDNFGYVNFEDERLRINSEDLNKVIEALYDIKGKNLDTIIFDEIQNVEGWESFVSRFIGSKKLIITGSNARLMSKELGTALTGRHVDFELFPFNFYEFLNYTGIKLSKNEIYLSENKATLLKKLEEYLLKGGFPIGIKNGSTYLLELYDDIIVRDILQRHNIRNINGAKEVLKYVSSSSSEMSYSKLSRIFNNISSQTIAKWIRYGEDSYLIVKIERYSKKLKEQFLAPKKIYSIDTGITSSISDENKNQKGKLMENLVAIELIRRNSYFNNKNIEVNYWKDYGQKEVDFLLRTGNIVKELIQVSYIINVIDKSNREFNSLLKASDELKCNNLLIITWDQSGEVKFGEKKIILKPLYLWLLEKYQ